MHGTRIMGQLIDPQVPSRLENDTLLSFGAEVRRRPHHISYTSEPRDEVFPECQFRFNYNVVDAQP
jgi:hypothetical protein